MRLAHRNTSGPLPTSTYNFVGDTGTVLGFCQIRHRPSHNAALPKAAANNLYYEIGEPFRGVGYGKELLRLALKEAKRIGLEKVRLAVNESNPASRHIIEGTGAVWLAAFPCEDGGTCHLYEVRLAQ